MPLEAVAKESRKSDELLQLVSFRLADEEFGVDILKVQEIIRMVDMTRVPNSPEFVEGVINLRGRIIPIIALRKKLGEILVEEKVISEKDLEAALKQQKKVGEILVKKKLVSPEQVEEALKRQEEVKRKVEEREGTQVIRIEVNRLDAIMNLVGELVLERNRLIQLNRDVRIRAGTEQFEDDLAKSSARLNFITTELQEGILKTRMLPIESP